MIIVSQDKTEIINFDRITEIIASENNICITDSIEQKREYVIATYETEKRAREILQEIIEAVRGKSKLTMSNEGITSEVFGEFYEMPED